MDKVELTKNFSHRLREALLAAKITSTRSPSGVCIKTLAGITGYSVQICRRYLSGTAIPEPVTLVEIAEKLNVSAGWLLFGDSYRNVNALKDNITISKSLLKYVLSYAAGLYQGSSNKDGVSDFLLELISDVSHIHANDEEQSKQIIKLAISSVKHFNR